MDHNRPRHNVVAFPGTWQDTDDMSADPDAHAEAQVRRVAEYVQHLEHGEPYVAELVEFIEHRRHEGIGGAALFEELKKYLEEKHPIVLRQIYIGRLGSKN